MSSPSHKLLIIAYYFPPTQVVAARRLFHFYQHIRAHFSAVKVISTANSRRMPREPAWQTDADLTYIEAEDLRSLLQGEEEAVRPAFAAEEKPAPLKQWLRRLRRSYPFVLWLGDGSEQYVNRAFAAGVKMVEEEGITHLFSSFSPWADHRVAARLKRRFPQLKWIADYRDLPVDQVRRDVWWPALQRFWLRRMLRKADVVTTVSEGLARPLRRIHPKVHVLRNGLAAWPPSFPSLGEEHHFTITYTGSLYPGLQSAELLLRTLRSMLDTQAMNPAHLQLRYVGKDGELWREWLGRHGLSHMADTRSVVDQNTALQLQSTSHINLLLTWSAPDSGGILTAKLYDYLAAGRPIIAILNGPPDAELSELVETTGGGRVFSTTDPDAPTSLQNFLLTCYRSWQFSGALPWQISREKLAPYTWPAQIAALVRRVFDAV